MNNALPPDASSSIAVVGFTGRFPGARNAEDFWRNLRNGVESITFFNDRELADSGVDARSLHDPRYVKAAGVLEEDPGLFDASFFGYSPREAEMIDPQQRIFLECAWQALESAGYDPAACQGSIGVYAGADINNYRLNLYSNPDIMAVMDGFQLANGNEKDHLTTRVAYKLNLRGPTVSVNTACSTSLVAVHLACQSLLNGECDLALAGGVSIKVPHKRGYQAGGIFSADGHCRAFDANASGTVGGSGVGVVVLKRLADAVSDGDHIRAVIRGSAINNDGSLKAGYTAPSVAGQAEVIAEALAIAGVNPETVTYVEAHGTGTPLGDPIEIAALEKAFRRTTQKRNFCALGSLKTNIGHLDTAAGVAGLIKTILSLEHKLLPPSLHFEKSNPEIDFSNSPFFVNTELSEWKGNGSPLRAGVSSFGIGGTNAHVVLEEAPTIESSSSPRPWQLLLVSAKTSAALETATTNLADYLKCHPEINFADAAYTLQLGRRPFDHRRIVICRDLPDALNALETLDPKRVFTSGEEPKSRSLSFLFPGQGSQYVNMALGLYRTEPVFRGYVDTCCEILKPHLGLDLRKVLYPGDENDQSVLCRLNQTAFTQPALFVVEYALARLLMDWGITPDAMIGHSIGEYVAACLAGVFSLEDGLGLVSMRGHLMDQQPAGAMIAVPLLEQEVGPLLGEWLSIAALNGPGFCVVSGPTDMIEQFETRLGEKGLKGRRLNTSHAFHSSMMEPVMALLAEQVKKIELHPPQIPYLSNVTGNWITAEEATDPNYWANHLRQPVRFSQGLQELLTQPNGILLEVGPGQTLSSLAKRHVAQASAQRALSTMCSSSDAQSDVNCLLTAVGQLWLSGVKINWTEFYASERRQRVPLPTYPFERQRYWVELALQTLTADMSRVDLHKRSDVASWLYVRSWKRADLPPNTSAVGQVSPPGTPPLLILGDGCGLGNQLAKRLEQRGQNVVTVTAGAQFERLGDRVYAIRPQEGADYDQLIKELRDNGQLPETIIHLWNVGANDESWDEASGFGSLLPLAQSFGRQITTTPLRIVVVSTNVSDVTGDEPLRPGRATLLGLCKVLPQEYANISCQSIDVITRESASQTDRLLTELSTQAADVVIAYRGNHRWVQIYEQVQANGTVSGPSRLREGGVYLITGGLGNIGLICAEYLARKARAKLILVGRSAFPAREEWDRWLAVHGREDEVSRKVERLQAIEALGAAVMVARANVASERQMSAVVEQATARFGPLNGIIHSAGVVGESSTSGIQAMGQREINVNFEPKARGLAVLETLLRGQNLDFWLLHSSLSTVLGGLGMAAYAAANGFMDAFAQRQNRTSSVPWINLNWDSWRFDGQSGLGGSMKELSLTPEEGEAILERMLALNTVPQVVVSTGELQRRLSKWVQRERPYERSARAETMTLHPRPNLRKAYAAPRNETERILADIWRELLGVEHVGIHDDFAELGGDSLLGTRVISRVRAVIQVELPMRTLFEAPTVAEMAECIQTILRATASNFSSAADADRTEIEL